MTLAQILLNPFFGEAYRDRILGMQSAYLIGYWPLNEASGTVCKDYSKATANFEKLSNITFESLGGDTFTSWTDRVSDGAIADEGVDVHGGSHACKLTAGAGRDTWITQNIYVTPGTVGTLSVWTHADGGAHAGRYAVYDVTNSAYIASMTPFTATGVTGTTYVQDTVTFTVPATCFQARIYLACPFNTGAICYFDDVTVTGNWNMYGYYPGSGITYGTTGPDGTKGITVDGNNTYANVGSRQWNTLFNTARGSSIAWGTIASAVWTDGTIRYFFHPKADDDDTYYIVYGKSATNNTLWWRRRAGGVIYEKTYAPAGPPTTWFGMGFTWDIANTAFKGFFSDGKTVTTCFDDSAATKGCDAWDLNALPITETGDTVLLAGNLTSQEWVGASAHHALWSGIALSNAEMRHVLTIP